jgi:tRNA dimethylallyltransferase
MGRMVGRGVLILAGPTASGKTEAAIALAQRFDAEIVGADSRQIYRGMPIGTAAPTDAQRAAVPHHLVGFLDAHERYSAARFARDAVAEIAAITARGKRAMVVGGTGFYIRALTGDVALAPQHEPALRDRLAVEARTHESSFLHAWLALRDPARAAAIEPNDSYRIVRALEIALAREDAAHEDVAVVTLRSVGTSYAKVFLDVRIEENDARIEARTSAMLAGGLLEEAEHIGDGAVAASAVGYPQALAFLRGWSTYAETHVALARATRRYARRQRAWFRSEPATHWVAPSDLERTARELLGWT